MTQRAAVILAAGQGTRMKSPTPKVLHRVGGRTLIDRAIDAAEGLGCERIVVVVGVEAREASAEELAVDACNTNVLAAPVDLLFDLLSKVGNANSKGEYYLTDIF